MTPLELKKGREQADLTQVQAGQKLAVSQAFLSMLEKGERRVSAKLARKAATLYRLPATVLPHTLNAASSRVPTLRPQVMAAELAALGYPGFSHLHSRRKRNPAELLFSALAQKDLEPRLTEALFWVVLRYTNLDWDWLLNLVKQHDLQNRLGFVTTFGVRVVESGRSDASKAAVLKKYESILDQARLVKEDTLCHESLSDAEKEWLRQSRPDDARHWNLLTDFRPEHFRYAA
jgi:transcriptional regulator with XRE-family HTH domain